MILIIMQREKMRKISKVAAILMAMTLAVTGCGSSNSNNETQAKNEKQKIVFALQAGIAYAPMKIMEAKKLVEKNYDGNVEIEWKIMNNGAEINEGITAGEIDFGALGVSPAIAAIKSGVPCKIYSGVSAIPYGIQTNKENIKSLKDITAEDQIVLANINSQPHILLAMAAKQILGDAHALDANLVAMGSADGYSSLLSGAVQCHMVISPYNFMENAEDNIHTIEVSEDVWPLGNTYIVALASNKIHDENADLYNAVLKATEEAMEFINSNTEETAQILSADYDADVKDIQTWLTDKAADYTTEVKGIADLSKFMVEEGFLDADKEVKDISEISFDNVKGN